MFKTKDSMILFLRFFVILLIIIIMIVAPLIGIGYGTTSAFTIGNFKIISPLEFLLLVFGNKKILTSWVIPTLTTVFIIFLFGRFFCGWICPIGLLLDFSHSITKKMFRKRICGMRKNLEKYVLLLIVLSASLTFNFAAPFIFSPAGSLHRFVIIVALKGVISIDIVFILFFLATDFFLIRFGKNWCMLCPFGTVISSISFLNLFKPRVNHDKCIDFDFNCFKCEIVCPLRLPIISGNRWTMMECNKCLKCWANCPVKAIRIDPLY